MNNLVTIRTFSHSTDFELVKAYLESCDIECFGTDEIINRTYFANVTGGVKLQVREAQLDEAIKLLVAGGYLSAEDMESSPEFRWAERIIEKLKKIFS